MRVARSAVDSRSATAHKPWRSALQTAAVVVTVVTAVILYFGSVHIATTRPGYALLGLILALAPIVSLVFLRILRTRGLFSAALFCLVCIVMGVGLRGPLDHNAARISLLEHLCVNLFLCALFGFSLFRGRQPMVTRFARLARGDDDMPARIIAYTRKATIAWSLFFALIAAVSIALYLLAPLSTWSAFANLLNFPLVVSMFIVEYLFRLRSVGDLIRPGAAKSILAGFRAFRDGAARRKE